MTWTMLYLRSRRVPLALAVALGGAGVVWALWLALADERDVAPTVVVMTVLLMVGVLSATLAGPDEDLERTAAMRWPWRRAVHLLAGLVVVLMVLLATRHTGARFGTAALVARDAAGLLGLTALCATVLGAARSWFLPLGWTTVAAMYPQEGVGGATATWQGQPPDNYAAAVTAAVLALGGLVAYSIAGPARKEPSEHVT
ncbi:hypothetical protein C1I95_02140 [Micromonospora craterilacus]|uniref:Uncharacterized protein n=1 Tax=Micromonospora craterilacus TaxID=1655439 RepID=A0A2W2FPR8_9ACTN|nr:hypothetical protein [Micromonospora craterilacus]PZG23847.1 hypothetical protein C1I95_02140 [Micromonospora craterilacus]